MGAQERLTLLRERISPDLDAKQRAACQVLQELKHAARAARWVVSKGESAGENIMISHPDCRANLQVVAIDGTISIWASNRRLPDIAFQYDPVRISVEGGLPVDVLADAVATELEKQLNVHKQPGF